MSSGDKAEGVFRALLKELGVECTEVQCERVLSFKSEKCDFTLSVHRAEDDSFDKTTLEKAPEGGEGSKKFEAAVDAVTLLLKAFSVEEKPKEEEKNDEKKDGESEKTEGEGEAGETPPEAPADAK